MPELWFDHFGHTILMTRGMRLGVTAFVIRPVGRAALGGSRGWLVVPLVSALGGCSADGASALTLFGAYFPDWLIFRIAALLIAIATRTIFGIAGQAEVTPCPLFTCLAVGILVAGAIDLLWLGR